MEDQSTVDEIAAEVARRVDRRHFHLLIKPFKKLNLQIPEGPHRVSCPLQ